MLAVVSMSYEQEADAQNKENEKETNRKLKESKKQQRMSLKVKHNLNKHNEIQSTTIIIVEPDDQNGVNNEIKLSEMENNSVSHITERNESLRFMDSEVKHFFVLQK